MTLVDVPMTKDDLCCAFGVEYTNTLTYIRQSILARYPLVISFEGGDLPFHLLWMVDELESGRYGPTKYARWIGWMLAMCETLGLFDNAKSQELVRSDLEIPVDD